ncbi:uncharacterized protein [Drosophila suzukii]|uniref:Uncharacterized protein isoform X2 n=1 Tax=Drosophila suzukii TaxID=28584 RepID=A0AB40DGL6_DROSZ
MMIMFSTEAPQHPDLLLYLQASRYRPSLVTKMYWKFPYEISFFKEAFDEYTHKTSTLSEDANTMTERDLGSTFLLPHTHLYKPDKILCDFAGLRSS